MEEVKLAIEKASNETAEQLNRCSGHCCVAFILTTPLDVIISAVENDPKGADYNYAFAANNFYKIGELNPTIMLTKEYRQVDLKTTLHSCKKFDHATRNCTAYNERPPVCKEHPHYHHYGSCKYEGCTYKSAPVKVMAK